ncbi:MAG: serpin family protein [Lachnospiraceae bacterium]|nr:serpin family protein [Lachnospiraceae bacterium]
MKKRFLAVTLCVTMILGLTACGTITEPQIQSKNLMEDLTTPTPGEEDTPANLENQYPLSGFGTKLLQQTVASAKADENVLVSPLSVLLALYMTANGADGNTKAQMMEVLGDNLNEYLKTYQESLPQGEDYKLHIANGIWFRDEEFLKVQEEFLRVNQQYFDAALYKAPFNDTTCKEINNWVKENTDGMIDSILDEISPDAVLYLINALSFDAKWQKPYNEYSVHKDRTFTKEDGTKQKATLMYSEESTYLEDEKATGFLKYYKDKKYAFAALLPKEGVTVAEYVAWLNGENLQNTLNNAKRTSVNAALPKFETEYDILLNDVLIGMGMPDAFSSSAADFSKMATSERGEIYINRVLHKTFISVDELGTKAGAVTAVEMTDECAPMEVYNVHLDRPFVYMLIDCETNQPFFIGTMMDVEK